jgi:hypothetical protein
MKFYMKTDYKVSYTLRPYVWNAANFEIELYYYYHY